MMNDLPLVNGRCLSSRCLNSHFLNSTTVLRSLRWIAVALLLSTVCYTQFIAAATSTSTAPTGTAAAPANTAGPAAVSPAPTASSPPGPINYGDVGYVSVSGPIDRLRKRYLSRVIDQARESKLDTLVVHINTDGGTVFDARDMFKKVLDQDKDGPRMVALVDYRAISAGAMIAYAHQELYVSETASIGDIGVIFKSAEGEIKYAPEKVETVVRTLLAQAAELRGWDRGLLLKMTAHKQLLYRVTLPGGAVHYVIQDDFPDFMSRHPGIDEDDPKQVIVYRGQDRLLTLTGREATRLGMATGLVRDKDELFERMGVQPEAVHDLSPNAAELTASWVAPFAPLLAGLALLLIVFELKTPGVGIWAVLGVVCGALFLLAQFYLDLAENFEVVLLVAGIALLAAEILTGLGGGMLGLAGGGLALCGLLLAFIPNDANFDLTDPRFLGLLGDAAWGTVLTVATFAAGMIAFVARMPGSGLVRRVGMPAEITAISAGKLEASSDSLVGRQTMADELLRPSGTVTLDGRRYSARAEHADYIAMGEPVEVIAVEFGELVVRACKPADVDADKGAGRP
jgi:membrane-bound serine protease (ClpP class)